ncbi:MAG: NAD(P)-dependent oxidoreductase, partial [Pseudomonadota bacterium]
SADELIERAKIAHIIVTNKVVFNQAVLSQLPELQHIACIATGYNNVDIDYCRDHNISVSNIRGYATDSVPEHTLALILALRRHVLAYQYAVQAGEWQRSSFFHRYLQPTLDLKESQIGLIGGGELGQAMANLARALGMKVRFADRKGKAPSGRPGYDSFDKIISQSDIISLHCPLTPDTENLITLTEMQQMKSTALLINTSRGGLVNEADLAAGIEQHLIAGAGLDVTTVEPIKENNPLLTLMDRPNFILTPHVAWTSDKAMQTQADQLIDIIEGVVQGNYQNRVV